MMAHCSYDRLQDFAYFFDELRRWTHIREPKPGIFYFKSKAFLHFHSKEEKRWAHLRSTGSWEEIDIPDTLTPKSRQYIVETIEKHHARLVNK